LVAFIMSRKLTARSTLETLKKEAKRWLKALQAGDPAARSRLLAATPASPAEPGLRDVQLALAPRGSRFRGHRGRHQAECARLPTRQCDGLQGAWRGPEQPARLFQTPPA
jgi:hypothetical protein